MALIDLFGGIGEAFNQLLAELELEFTLIHTVYPRSREIIDLIQSEIDAWSRFNRDFPHVFANRVINVVAARRKVSGIVEGLSVSWTAIKDIGTVLREHPPSALVNTLESSRNPIVRGIGRVIHGLQLLGFYAEKVAAILDDLEQIIQEAQAIRLAVQNVEAIFLKQDNPRQRVKLADGGSIRIRVGSLHTGEL